MKYIFFLLVLWSSCSLSACSLTLNEGTPSRFPWPIDPRGPSELRGISRSISINITPEYRDEWDSGETYIARIFLKEAAATTVLAFKDSGLFPHVLIGNQNADYQVDLILTGTRQYNAPMVRLSNITLWLIPHTVTNTIQLQMTIQDKQGMILGKLKTSDQERKINGLLLLPFFPLLMFINDPGGWDTLIYNAVQAGIIEANQKAIF